jgi:hypothetical protein
VNEKTNMSDANATCMDDGDENEKGSCDSESQRGQKTPVIRNKTSSQKANTIKKKAKSTSCSCAK